MQEEVAAQVRAAIEESQRAKRQMVVGSMRHLSGQAVLGSKLEAAQVDLTLTLALALSPTRTQALPQTRTQTLPQPQP